jgi:LysM repeat protein
VIVPLDGPMSTVVARRIAEPQPSEVQFHRVRRGETLSGIARRYHLSQRQVRVWNHLNARGTLRAGQRLRVSAPAAQRAKQASRKIASKKSVTHVTRLAGKAGGVSHSAAVQRHDRLRVEQQALLRERTMDAVHPFHLAVAQRHLAVLGPIHLHAVAALVLGHVTGRVGRGQHPRQRARTLRDVDHADRHAHRERAALPGEAEVGDRAAQVLGNA